MKETTSKEQILKKIRDALISKKENPFAHINFNHPVFNDISEEKEIQFAKKLIEMGGSFIYCENENSFLQNLNVLQKEKGWKEVFTIDEKLQALLSSGNINYDSNPENFTGQKVGMTRCEYFIARFGTVLVSSGLNSGRRMFVFPEVHIIVGYASQVVTDLKNALQGIKKKYANNFPSQITAITGPSRTADIEKTLVMGAHGPKELFVFMIDDLE